MSYGFKVRFNNEFLSIEEFSNWIEDSLARHEVDERYTLALITSFISQDCKVVQAASEASEVEVALLKTTFLEIIDCIKRNSRSDKERNRRKFDQAIQSLFDGPNENASNFFASITRQLYQFGLGRTYDAREIIAEAYARGVKSINSGKNIHNPFGWLRRTSMNVIRELKRDQVRRENHALSVDIINSGIASKSTYTDEFICEAARANVLRLRLLEKTYESIVGTNKEKSHLDRRFSEKPFDKPENREESDFEERIMYGISNLLGKIMHEEIAEEAIGDFWEMHYYFRESKVSPIIRTFKALMIAFYMMVSSIRISIQNRRNGGNSSVGEEDLNSDSRPYPSHL